MSVSTKQLRSRTVGGTGFPMLPEILENVFSFLDSETLLKTRGVCKAWNSEACRTLGKRGDYAIQWGSDGNPMDPEDWLVPVTRHRMADDILKFRGCMTATLNPQLFTACYMESTARFKMARGLFVEDCGRRLTRININLGEDFPMKHHLRNLESLYRLCTEWAPNAVELQLTLPLDNMKKLNHLAEEAYNPRFHLGKRTKLREFVARGMLAPYFPKFAVDVIQSSPHLKELSLVELPPNQWRTYYYGPAVDTQHNTKFLLMLQQANDVMRGVTKFDFQYTNEMFRNIYFETPTSMEGRILGVQFEGLGFSSLESLVLDASFVGREKADVQSLERVLDRNPGVKTLGFEPCAVDAPLTIVMGNLNRHQCLVISSYLPRLKKIVINSVRCKNINLFRSLQNFPNLEILEIRKQDPNHYLYYPAQSYFFKADNSLKSNPVRNLRKLIYDYPLHKPRDLEAIFDSFPCLDVFESPFCFGERFLFGPNEMLGDVSFNTSTTKLPLMLIRFSRYIRKLNTLRINTHHEVHSPLDWAKSFRRMRKLNGLKLLEIDCSRSSQMEYYDKIKRMKRNYKMVPFPVRVLPEGFVKLFTDSTGQTLLIPVPFE